MKKILLIVLITAGIYLIFRFLLPLVIPFLIAGIVSVLYYPFLRKMFKDSRLWSGKQKKWLLVFAVVLFYVVVVALVSILFAYLFGQCESIWLNFPFYQARILAVVKDFCEYVDTFLRIDNGKSYAYIENVVGAVVVTDWSGVLPKVTGYSVQVVSSIFEIVFEVIVTVMATFFLIQDYEELRKKMLEVEWGKSVCKMVAKCKETLQAYVKAQGFIMLLDGLVCTLAFLLIEQPYYLVMGPLVALLDALPVLGAGIFLIPYSVYLLIVGDVGSALVVLLAYIGCVVVRQLTEPRMIGNKIGLRPIYTLLSMYVGFQLFGIIGFLLGPVGVLAGQEIYSALANTVQ